MLPVPEKLQESFESLLREYLPDNTVTVTSGGKTRTASVQNALALMPPSIRYIAIHDAARPLISAEVLDDCIAAAGESGGAFDGLPEGWREFAQGLSAEDIGLLRALSGGSAEEYCRSRGVMPETEYDRINAAAMENIGDILIEDGGIIPDYAPDVENILSLT